MKKIKQRNGIKNNIYVASSQGFPGPPSLTTLKIIITYFDYNVHDDPWSCTMLCD